MIQTDDATNNLVQMASRGEAGGGRPGQGRWAGGPVGDADGARCGSSCSGLEDALQGLRKA